MTKTPWYSVFQFALSALGVFGLWALALTFAAMGVVQETGSQAVPGGLLSTLLTAAGLAVSGALLLPSAVYAFLRVIGKPDTDRPHLPFLRPTLLILFLPLVLLLGYWVSRQEVIAWLFLPPLHILAVGLPVLWVLYLGRRDLPAGTPQRMWGVFGSGLVLGPALILVLEIAALLAFVLIAIIVVAASPDLMDELTRLGQQFMFGRPSPEELAQIFGGYITRPAVILAILAYGSVVVPLIEELIKPVGVWLLAGRSLTPYEGFVAGALSGAGYALFESLALSANGGEEWVYVVVARIGTAFIHILTTSLMGWALALAWRDRRYFNLLLTYLTAVTIHGLWNGLTLMATVSQLASAQGEQPPLLVERLGLAAPAALVLLAAGAFATLLLANRALRRTSRAEAQPGPA